jgi:hypothetical protein
MSTASNPSFPLRIFGALVLVAAVTWGFWWLWPPGVSVTKPSASVWEDRITAEARVINSTAITQSVTVAFTLGYRTAGKGGSAFRPRERRHINIQLAGGSTEVVQCGFARPATPPATLASYVVEAHIVAVEN